MLPNFSGEAFVLPLVLVVLLYLLGHWAELAFSDAAGRYGRFALYPLLGLISLTSLVTAGSYAGIPIAQSSFFALLCHAPFTILGLRRARRDLGAPFPGTGWVLAVVTGALIVFLWPYAKDRSFYVFGDSYTYMTIADYLRDYSYRDAPLDFDRFPWKSHPAMYIAGHFRAGAQVFLGFVSACFGIGSERAYMPVTGTFLVISFLSLSGFVRSFTSSPMSLFATMALYLFNIFFVLGPSINNFLPQIPGIACLMLLFAVPIDKGSYSEAGLRGVVGAGILLFYPEIAIFAVGGVLCNFGASILGKVVSTGVALRSLSITLAVAVLINPLTAYYGVYSLVQHSKGRSGYDVPLNLLLLLRSLVGYQGFTDPGFILSVVGTITGALACGFLVWGLFGLERTHLVRWLSSALLLACAGVYTYFFANYSYATFKTLNYGFFLLATGMGLGWGSLWLRFQGRRALLAVLGVIAMIWAGGLTSIMREFVSTHYDMERHPINAHPKGLRGFAGEYEDLSALSRIPRVGEETFVFIPTAPVERWATFFFRAPVDLYFREGVPLVGVPKSPRSVNQRYILGETGATAFQDPKALIFQNSRFSFSKAQPTVSLTNRGWSPEETVGGKPRRWMTNEADLVVWMPKSGSIRLQAGVVNPSFPKIQGLDVFVDDKASGSVRFEASESIFDSGEVALLAGLHTIRFKTQMPVKGAASGDTRVLALLWERIRFAEPTPSEIILSEARSDLQMKGLSADRWLMDRAAEFVIAVPQSSRKYLRVQGDLPGIPSVIPQTLIATFGGGSAVTSIISKPGPFEVDLPIPAEVSGEVAVSLRVSKTFSPAAVSANPDTRQLGVRVLAVAVKN